MPDIIEINKEIRNRIMGARATLDVYTYLGGDLFIDCPRVNVRFDRDDQIHQASAHFTPEVWPHISPAWIGALFVEKFEGVL